MTGFERFLRSRLFFWVAALSVAAFILALIGYLIPAVNQTFFWLVMGVVLVVSLRWPAVSLIAVLVELVLGGKGYLFSTNLAGFVISLRLGLFIVVFISWLISRWHDRAWRFWRSPAVWPTVAVLAVISLGAINGWLHHQPSLTFFDVNGYLFFGLLVVAFDLVRTKLSVARLLTAAVAASTSLAVVTVFLFVYFTLQPTDDLIVATSLTDTQLAQLGQTPETARLGQALSLEQRLTHVRYGEGGGNVDIIYRWLRDTGQAEVSYLGGRFFRVFFYSHLFLIFTFLLVLVWPDREQRTIRVGRLMVGVASAIALIISFSRSFWLGVIVGCLAALWFMPRSQRWKFFGLAVASIGLLVLGFAFLSPPVFTVFSDRVTSLFNPTSEIATQTRLNLLPTLLDKIKAEALFGHGFGATVVFTTFVPGTEMIEYVSAYLFEWTYLDILVKIGLIGLAAFAFFAISLFRLLLRCYRYGNEAVTRWLIVSLVAFFIVNVTTPYLNHPIGIGWLLLTTLTAAVMSRTTDHHD